MSAVRRGEGKTGDAAGQKNAAPQPQAEASADSRPVKRVSWPVEDPSEFRPELAPGGPLEELGKQTEDFRVYYEVRWERDAHV